MLSQLFDLPISFRWLALILLIGLRYFLVASVFFLIFYVALRHKWEVWKIQPKVPNGEDYRREILFSSLTILIFSVHALCLFNPTVMPYTNMYKNVSDYGWAYLVFSFVAVLFIHDTYFYWMHRLIHHPKLYKSFHLTHHKSTNPSPWAALAFHPLEAVLESGIISILVFTIPTHRLTILLFLFFMMIYNAYGHLGYELYPKGFSRSRFGKWINTSVNHNMHHQFVQGNYGLYFLFWDRLMGTLSVDYDEHFDRATQKKNEVLN